MVRKVFRAGSGLAVAIPGAMAEALGIGEGDFVHLEHDAAAGAVLLWPRAAHTRLGVSSEYVHVVGAFLRDYGDALAALEQEDAAPWPDHPSGSPPPARPTAPAAG
jgi:hypothetical protein